jgi:DNA-binding MarR family transcriptional regulator
MQYLRRKIFHDMSRPTSSANCDDAAVHAYGVTLEALARLNHLFDHSLRSRVGISQTWFEALLRIERTGGQMTMGELAGQVALTSGGVTRLVDRLIEQRYVVRRPCPEDRRVHYVAITERGQDVLHQALEVHLDDLRSEFIGRMTDEERSTVVEVMDRLRSAG